MCIRDSFRTALLLLRWNLSAVLRSGSLALCVLAPLYAVILGIGLQNTAAMVALSRASLLVEVPFFQFLLDCSITIAQCSILFLLYRRLREGDAVPEDTQNGKPVRAKGRRLLAAAVVGVTLVTIGLSFIYIALPTDDELRTMLGGAAPIVTAHRGYSTAAPENTLPAFQLAIDHHSDRAELDVQMTKDGVVMVTHDTSLRRCTGRNANIYDLTFAQVREAGCRAVVQCPVRRYADPNTGRGAGPVQGENPAEHRDQAQCRHPGAGSGNHPHHPRKRLCTGLHHHLAEL